MFAAAIKVPTGKVLYYTGKAGSAYLSKDINNAFFGYSRSGAMRKAVELCVPRDAGLCAEHEPMAISSSLVAESEGGHCD